MPKARTPRVVAPKTTEFIQSLRKRNRNFRMPPDTEDALLQAAQDLSPDNNVSDIFRRICDGRLEDLVDLQYLCPICRGWHCTAHKAEAEQWRLERDQALYLKLHQRFKHLTRSHSNGTVDAKES